MLIITAAERVNGEIHVKGVTYRDDRAAGSHDHIQVSEVCCRTGRMNVVSAMDQKKDFPENFAKNTIC